MRWQKFGIVFHPDTSHGWSRSHAMLPTPLLLDGGATVRVFYTTCDAQGLSRPSFFDLDPSDPSKVVYAHSEPLLELGQPGTFDENGVLATSVVRAPDGQLHMYYVGFELGTRIRYRLLTGLAVSEDDGLTFRRVAVTPILERSDQELFFRGGPFVLYEENRFKMWYVAGSRWIDVGGKQMPEFRMKYLESPDGIRWGHAGRLVMDVSDPDEYGFGRPWVVRQEDRYSMFYSIRRRSFGAYRLGYATSTNGIDWKRMDSSLNLDVGPSSYDDRAIEYAVPISAQGRTWCLYNGNDFGREGIALARLESL
jgi:hypothetical protein